MVMILKIEFLYLVILVSSMSKDNGPDTVRANTTPANLKVSQGVHKNTAAEVEGDGSVFSSNHILSRGSQQKAKQQEMKNRSHAVFKKDVIYWALFACGRDAVCEYEPSEDYPKHRHPLLHCEGCRCDPDCLLFDDCCPDMYTEEQLYNRTSDPSFQLAICQSQYLKVKHNGQKGHHYLFVNKCPVEFTDDEVKGRCENGPFDYGDSKLYLPVYSVETRRTYRNWHCAVCHKDASEPREWGTEISCDGYVDVGQITEEKDLIQVVSKISHCDIKLITPVESGIRECFSPQALVSNRCTSDDTLSLGDGVNSTPQPQCFAFTNVVVISEGLYLTWYKNIFCAFLCGFNSKDLANKVQAPDPHRNRGDGTVIPVQSFSMLFNFNPERTQSVDEQGAGDRGCHGNEVYDPHQMSCRKIFCSKGRMISNHKCVPVHRSAQGVGYRIRYTLVPAETPHRLHGTLVEVWEVFNKDFYLKHRSYLFDVRSLFENSTMTALYSESEGYDGTIEIDVFAFHIEFSLVVGVALPTYDLEVKLLDMMSDAWVFGGNVWNPMDGGNLRSWNDVEAEQSFIRSRKNLFGGDLPEAFLNNPDAFIDISVLNRCAQLELNESEYILENGTGTLNLLTSEKPKPISEYTVIDGKIRICVNYTDMRMTENILRDNKNLERILTLSSFTVSLVCMCLTLIAYMIVPIRYTVPGKTTMALILSLFVAQILFLVGGSVDSSPWVCRCFGVAIHYFWLKVFCWKNIMAFHMFMVFTNPLKYRSQAQGLRFRRYCAYAFVMPAVLVAAFITAHLVMSDSQDIGYGSQNCFISRSMDIGLAFALPVGIIVVANGYFFVKTILVIRKMSEMEKHSNKANVRQTSNYIKLSFHLGLTWTIGFVANAVQSPVVWYIFIFINGSLGLVIFVCQVCNTNMIGLIKLKFHLLYPDASTSSKTYDTQDS